MDKERLQDLVALKGGTNWEPEGFARITYKIFRVSFDSKGITVFEEDYTDFELIKKLNSPKFKPLFEDINQQLEKIS